MLVFVAFLVTLLVLLVFATELGEWLIVSRLRASPHRDQRVRITLSADGLSTWTSAEGRTHLPWTACTRVRRLDDGYLVFRGPVFHWLPIDALTRSSADEAAAILQRHVADYRGA